MGWLDHNAILDSSWDRATESVIAAVITTMVLATLRWSKFAVSASAMATFYVLSLMQTHED